MSTTKIPKGVIRICTLKKDRQYNDQRDKQTDNGPINTIQKTKDWTTRTPLKRGCT